MANRYGKNVPVKLWGNCVVSLPPPKLVADLVITYGWAVYVLLIIIAIEIGL